MPKFYRFIFYKIYKYLIGIGRKDIPERKAVAVFSLWVGFYIGLTIPIVKYFVPEFYVSKLITATILIAINLAHFFILIYSKEHLRIYREFDKDSEYRKKHKLLVPVFLLFPFVMVAVFAFTIWS